MDSYKYGEFQLSFIQNAQNSEIMGKKCLACDRGVFQVYINCDLNMIL